MKKLIKWITPITMVVVLYSCRPMFHASGPLVSSDRELVQFSKVTLKGSMDIVLTQDSDYTITVEAAERKMKYISTKIIDGRLVVNVPDNKKITVYVPGHVLNEVVIDGSGNITADGELHPNSFEAGIRGSGDVKLNINANSMKVTIDGSGDVDLSGEAKSYNIEVKGSGNIESRNFKVESCGVEIKGSGDCWVYVTDSLNITIDGSGNVYYRGDPETVVTDISGSGKIIPIQ